MKIKIWILPVVFMTSFTGSLTPQAQLKANSFSAKSPKIETQKQKGLAWHSNGQLAWDGVNGWHENGQLAWNGLEKNGWHKDGKLAWSSSDMKGWHNNTIRQLAWYGKDMNAWHENGQLAWNGKDNNCWHKNGQLAGDHIEITLGTGFILYVDNSIIKLYVAGKFIKP